MPVPVETEGRDLSVEPMDNGSAENIRVDMAFLCKIASVEDLAWVSWPLALAQTIRQSL